MLAREVDADHPLRCAVSGCRALPPERIDRQFLVSTKPVSVAITPEMLPVGLV